MIDKPVIGRHAGSVKRMSCKDDYQDINKEQEIMCTYFVYRCLLPCGKDALPVLVLAWILKVKGDAEVF